LSGADLNRYKPLWWLTRQADAAVVGEISRRQLAGELSDGQLGDVVDAALAAQADVTRPWLNGWGDAIERARIDGKLSDEKWRLYAKQVLPLSLVARPRIRAGDPIPIEVHYAGLRSAANSRLRAHLRVMRAFLGDEKLGGLLPEDTAGGGLEMHIQGGRSGRAALERLTAPKDMMSRFAGTRAVRADVAVDMLEPAGGRSDTQSVVAREVKLDCRTTIVAPTEPTVELVRGDAATRAAMRAALQIRTHNRSGQRSLDPGPVIRVNNDGARLIVQAADPPIGLAFDVLLRDRHGREWPLHAIDFRPQVNGTWYVSEHLDDFNDEYADVILRPSAARAASTIELTRIWNEEIVFPKLPVRYDEKTVRPTTLPGWLRRQRQ
jgi:hypothetical protein